MSKQLIAARSCHSFAFCLQVPSKDARKLYLMYARFEEEHGLARRAMRVYDMLVKAVPPEERYDVCILSFCCACLCV